MFPTVADAYDRYIGRYSTQLASQFTAVVGVGADQLVLDIGCGPGSLTTALVERIGRGRVFAIDPSQPYAEACRRQAQGADVVVGRAQALPFADESFDVVLAQLVVNLLEDPDAGVREMARVTQSGGTVAAVVWAQDGMSLLGAFWDAAMAVALDAVAAVGESGKVGYRSRQLLELWERCDLTGPSMVQLEATAGTRTSTICGLPSRPASGSRASCAACSTQDVEAPCGRRCTTGSVHPLAPSDSAPEHGASKAEPRAEPGSPAHPARPERSIWACRGNRDHRPGPARPCGPTGRRSHLRRSLRCR